MAERRMLTSKIIGNDNFVALPSAAQALYMHLVMSADDDGFCSQVSTAMFHAHAKKKDLEALVNARYLLRFENGVMVIKHWRMANATRADRYTPTVYQEEYARLTMKANKAYTMATVWQPSDATSQPQKRIEENRRKEKRREEDKLVVVDTRARVDEPEAENDLGRVMNYYMDHINPVPSPYCVDLLKGYTETLGGDVVIHAFGIAQDERKTGWSYIQAILQRYERDGLTSMEAVLQAEAAFAAKKEAKQAGADTSNIFLQIIEEGRVNDTR